ncbi:MAG TPA: NAD-dependent epimerase/dehydratase family protein [Tepidisphaeraceae bacterium]|nr:NAD-dependent epimerase/dehydratase family protein [Tepidisphaeraceae bacterium]
MKRFFITGGAGFIGSNLADRLLGQGHAVTAFDNLSTGQPRFLESARASAHFQFIQGDLLDAVAIRHAVAGHDAVFHMAANADVRFGLEHPEKDLQNNTIATFNVLEAMRAGGVKTIAFASTGSVYGEPDVFPTPENCPFPIQTSLYAASKIAGEGLITAYATGYGFRAYIFRFVSILGDRYSHGHVFDFYRKLLDNPSEIEVLGDGNQRKSYLHIQDCLDAIQTAMEKATEAVSIFNLGRDDYCAVNQSLDCICEELKLTPRRRYTGGARGWVGDSPFILLDTARIKSLGWRAKIAIPDAVVRTLRYLQENQWLLTERK